MSNCNSSPAEPIFSGYLVHSSCDMLAVLPCPVATCFHNLLPPSSLGIHPTVVHSLSHVQLFATSWTAAHQASLCFTTSWSLLKLTSIELGDAIQPTHPLTSPSPPALNLPQHQGLFQRIGSLHADASASVLLMNTQA